MEVAEAYAEITGLTVKEVEDFTDKNAERFFVL
jgi:Tat protein secretion system quality control protein TatD with DNase activity